MRAFLFDLDDTLFDHRHSTRVALGVIQRHLPALAALPLDVLEERHGVVLESVHQQVLAGVLSVDDARIARFRRLVETHGGTPRAGEIEQAARAYRAAYREARRPVPGAVALLKTLRPHGAIGVVSNNILSEQQDKIAACGMREHIDVLLVSEEAGCAKPDPAIFRMALEKLGAAPEETIMIGDSWSADIAGARAAGIRPVWFNPLKRPCPDQSVIAGQIGCWEPPDAVVERLLRC